MIEAAAVLEDAAEAVAPSVARTSLRQVLWGLVVVLSLPTATVATAGLYSAYRAEQTATDLRLRETTRAMSLSLDREIEKTEVAMHVLASSPHLRSRDFTSFHGQILDAGIANSSWVALFDSTGQAIVSTRVPFGTPLPASARPETIARIVATRRAELSDLFNGAVSGQPLVTIDVPVILDDQVAFVLGTAVGPDVFQRLIEEQRIPAGWNAAVIDRAGRIVGRARSPERYIGQSVRPELASAITTSSDGSVSTITLDGIPAQSYFHRAPNTGWAFVISIPQSELGAAVRRPVMWLSFLLGIIVLGVAMAALLSRRIAQPVDQLVRAARGVGRGLPTTPTSTRVVEFDAIQSALEEAASAIKRQNAERAHALALSADAEARLRLALTAGALGTWEFVPATGTLTMSAESRAHLGRETGPAPTYAELVAAIHPEDRDLHQKTVTEALATKGDLKIEVRVRWPDTSDHWLEITGRARQAADGQVTLAGVSQDVTERRQAGDRQGLLLHELNHRVKNTLATVQSVASLTRRSAEPGDPALWDAFMGRLQGLAVTNDLLTATNWTGAVLDDVLRSELDPYQDALGQRIRLRGPRVSLQPSAVLAFGLAIHELATNAAKYGSLSNASGRVNVTWAVTRGTAPPALLVEWIETGGPSVAPPQRQGFGTKLIKRGLAQQLGGELKLEFPPDGVRCVISFPLASVTVAAKADYETSRSGSS